MNIKWSLIVLISLFLTGCIPEDQTEEFRGIVTEVQLTNHIIVEPYEDESIRASGTEVSVSVPDDQQFEVGDAVLVTHEGPVMESHPLQIHLVSIERIDE
ncbi:MAG: hypothetical protein JJU16_12070 [Alkalibacterium sp.]|nr:hypothetical protein [Alkalibacterium sp.]